MSKDLQRETSKQRFVFFSAFNTTNGINEPFFDLQRIDLLCSFIETKALQLPTQPPSYVFIKQPKSIDINNHQCVN